MQKLQEDLYNIVIRDENCDNLISQTIEFLEVVKGLKKENRLNIKISMEDVREACCVYKGQVVWGHSEIVKLLMKSRPNPIKTQFFGSKSPYAENDVMNETFSQVNPTHEQINKFHEQILLQGDHDASDQLDSPNKQMNFQPKEPKQSQFNNKENTKQKPVIMDQVALDNDYHSRFLDELKSGGE